MTFLIKCQMHFKNSNHIKLNLFDLIGWRVKYDKNQHNRGHFAKFLEECGIVVLYTMLRMLKENGVAERCNRTLFLWIWCLVWLPIPFIKLFMWEALKTVTYILNRVPTKFVPKTLFKLWTRQKPSFNHFWVWSC